jgi:hypothetical protein
MGSKELAKIRESVVAQVKAGTMTAKDAYPALRGGSYKRGEFENLENQAKAAGKGQWASLSTSAKNAAAAAPVIKPPSNTPAKSDQRAKALGVDPREYAADRNTTVASPKNALSKSDQRADALGVDRREYASNPNKYDNVQKNALATSKSTPAPATGYSLTSTKGLDMGDAVGKQTAMFKSSVNAALTELDKLTAAGRGIGPTAQDLRNMIATYSGELVGSGALSSAERSQYIAMMDWANDSTTGARPTLGDKAGESLPTVNWVDELWDKTPAATAEQMANRGDGSVTVGSQGNSVSDPKLQAGIIKDVDTNLGDRIEKLTKTVSNTDPTIAGSGRQLGGKPDTPWSGPVTPTGQGALPAATIGSGAAGTKEAVAAAVARAVAEKADPATIAAIAKQTAIAYGASTDAATNIAADVLMNKGVPMETAIRMASSAPSSVAGSTAGPVAGYGSTAPGVTSNGVTGVTGQADDAGVTTSQGTTPTPPVAAGGSTLVNGGTGTVQTPVATGSESSPLVNGGTAPPPTGGFDPVTGLPLVLGAAGAAASVLTGNAMADAQIRAAQIQADSAEKARAFLESQYNQSRTDFTPWRSAGEEALGYDRDVQGQLVERASGGLRTFEADNPQFKSDPFKFDTTGANADPSYNFRLSEGLKALQSSAAAKGMLRSGNTMQAITDYGQGAASQEYNNAFSRYQTNKTNDFNIFNTQRGSKLNALQSLAGVGQSAVTQMSNAGQNYATNAGNAMMTGANATANGMTGAANDRASGWMGGIQTGMNALGMAINYGNQRDMSNAFAKYYGS